MGLKREGGDRGHDEVRSLTGGPLEVRGTLNVQPGDVGRQELDRRVEFVRGLVEAEVEVVVVEDARQAECTVESPDKEGRPYEVAVIEPFAMEVRSENQDAMMR